MYPRNWLMIGFTLMMLAFSVRANAGPSFRDDDHDGIDDGVEMDLARRFFPNISFSAGDGCLGPAKFVFFGQLQGPNKPVVFRVRFPTTAPGGYGIPTTLAISYVLLYYTDCAADLLASHPDDNESFMVFLRWDPTAAGGAGDWAFSHITTNPHRGKACEDIEVSLSLDPDGRPHLYVGVHKHSNYTYKTHTACFGDDEVRDPTFDTHGDTYYNFFNLGEFSNRLLTDLAVADPAWAGRNPWTDNFGQAGLIEDDVELKHYYMFPPPNPETDWDAVGPACSYNFGASPGTFAASGSTQVLSLSTSFPCAWRISTSANWISVAVSNPGYPWPDQHAGAGSATFTITTAPNTSAFTRTAQLFIGGLALLVQQAGVGCNYSVTPSEQHFSVSGGSALFTLTAGASNCSWTATTNASWLTISPVSGAGAATLTLTVASTASSVPRSSWVQLNGVNVLQIAQDARPCAFTLSETAVTLTHTGSTRTLNVGATPADCQWRATSSANWLTVAGAGATHTGGSSISYQVANNAGPTRLAAIAIAPVPPSVGTTATATIRELGVDWLSPVLSILFGKGGSQ